MNQEKNSKSRKQYVAELKLPFSKRYESIQTLLDSSKTFFVCQTDDNTDLFISEIPTGIVHARILATAKVQSESDHLELSSLDIKKIEVDSKDISLLLHMYRDYGPMKTSVVSANHEKLQKPFSNFETLLTDFSLLPIALLFGNWKEVG